MFHVYKSDLLVSKRNKLPVFIEELNELKNKNLSIQFDYLPQEDHATIMHQAVFNALRLLYPAPKKDN